MRKPTVGDWVEVRTKEEILRTLDNKGELDGMPFMPEMFAFCGQRFQVYKRAHKTCDTVFPIRGRRVDGSVHLSTRCDGSAHGGCEANCLLFWKEAWLQPVDRDPARQEDSREDVSPGTHQCSERDVWASAHKPSTNGGSSTYVCQATRLPYATTPLAWWDVRQYVDDYRSGNVGLWRLLSGFVYSGYYSLSNAGIGVGAAMRWLYDTFHPVWGGTRWPRKKGSIPEGHPTPSVELKLEPGELVRVKSHEDILRTINTDSKNRGMYWDAEMVPYCGGTYRVLKRVRKIIDEKTGRLIEMKNPCIMLDSVVCQSRYSFCRMFCPRSIHPYWREVWLERLPEGTHVSSTR